MTKLTNAKIDILKAWATYDYQKRGGNYPASNIPDTIILWEEEKTIVVTFEFKNTDEKIVEKWVRGNVAAKIGEQVKVIVEQTGDYYGDWVTATVEFKK